MRALLALLLCAAGAGQSPADVANAELAFAKLASEQGVDAAFLAKLAEKSLVLRPEPVDARAFYAKDAEKGFLAWRPTWVGLAASGDLAYSTGPWEYRSTKDAPPIARGHFLSVWEKRADGIWKVAFDCGVSHPECAEPETWTAFLPAAPAPTKDGAKTLSAADRALSKPGGLVGALAFGAVIYRTRALPMADRRTVTETLAREPARRFEPAGARTSTAQDLGYTWGTATAADGGQVSYLHIWVRPSGTWRLLYDLEQALPKKP